MLSDANATLPLEIRETFSDDYNEIPPPGVPVLCLHGYGVETYATLLYEDDSFSQMKGLLMESGDESILYDSLAYCSNWIGQQEEPVFWGPMFNVTHNGIINETLTWEYIGQWLTNISQYLNDSNTRNAQDLSTTISF